MNREEYKNHIIYKIIPGEIERYLRSKSTINKSAILSSICDDIKELDDYLMKDMYYNTKKNVKYTPAKQKYTK